MAANLRMYSKKLPTRSSILRAQTLIRSNKQRMMQAKLRPQKVKEKAL